MYWVVLMYMSHCSWSPTVSGPLGPSTAIIVAVGDPPGPSMIVTDGPTLPQVISFLLA